VGPPLPPRDAGVTFNSPSTGTSLPDHEIVAVESPRRREPELPRGYRADKASRIRAALMTFPFASDRARAWRRASVDSSFLPANPST